MRRVLLFLAIAGPTANADPDFDSLVKRLGSDDAAVRVAALEEAKGLDSRWAPELEKLAGSAKDVETAAALREAALWVEEGRHLPFAIALASTNRESLALTLNKVGAPRAVPALIVWLRHAGEEDFPVEDTEGRDGESEGMEAVPAQVLAAETFADFGSDANGWRRFWREHEGDSAEGLRVAGLVASGFRVDLADASQAADAWIAAWEAAHRGTRKWRDLGPGNRERLLANLESLLLVRFPPQAFGMDFREDAKFASAREWLAANRDRLVLEAGRFRSDVPVEELVRRLEDPDASVRRGALRSLVQDPGSIPDSAWDHPEDADIFAAALAESGKSVPAAQVGAALASIGEHVMEEPFRQIWDLDQVGAWLAAAPDGAEGIREGVRVILFGRWNAGVFPPEAAPHPQPGKNAPRYDPDEQSVEAVEAAASDWIAANRGFVEFREGSFRSRAKPADLRKRLEGGDAAAARGALRSLASNPADIPDSAWNLLSTDPAFLLRFMTDLHKRPPASHLRDVMALVQAPLGRFRDFWDLYAVADWLSASKKDDPLRPAVVVLLLEQGEECHLQTVIDVMGPPEKFEFEMDQGRAESLGRSGMPASGRFALAWAAKATDQQKESMAWSLAQSGQRPGLEMIAALIADRKLGEPDLAKLRYSVAGCPPDYDLDAWVKWAKSDLGRYSWDLVKGKWIPK